jgi:hypothetical protein
MTTNQIFTRIILLGLFFGPLTWLLVSDEGQRVSDVFLLKLSGAPAVEMDVRQLAPAVNEAELKSRFPSVTFQCADKQTDFGERLCYSPLAAFNGAPSQYLSAFFRGDHLMAIKVAYQRSYHDYIYGRLTRELGPANRDRDARLVDNGGAQQWQAGKGWLVLPGVGLKEDAEPALFWLAAP